MYSGTSKMGFVSAFGAMAVAGLTPKSTALNSNETSKPLNIVLIVYFTGLVVIARKTATIAALVIASQPISG